MSIFFRRALYGKAVSLLLALAFLVESTLAPILLFLPQTASAQTASITIARTPATSATNPYKVGDATTISSTNPPSLFAINLTVIGYNQIGSSAPRTFTTSTFALRDSGACNASTGQCIIPGNWDASSFMCPAGVTGTQQMTEWYDVVGVISNKITWYFQCSGTISPSTQTPVGYLDSIDTNGTASGWAVDPDSPATSISVHFYIDGAAGQGGIYAGSAVANLPRPDLNATYPGNHGFNFSIPAQWRDGKAHTLYVHGIDLSGDGSKNVLLSNVPKSFTLGTPVSNNPTLSFNAFSIVQGSTFTGAVTGAAPGVTIRVFAKGPDGAITEDASGVTSAAGTFSRTYTTTGWALGAYQGWTTVNGVQSNLVTYIITASPVANTPVVSLSSVAFTAGTPFTVWVANAAPNSVLKVFCRDPNNVVCDDSASYTTNASGQFTHTYDTTGWTAGSYQGWTTVNGVQSNMANFTVAAPATAQTITIARTPATSQTNPYKVGDATTFSSISSPSFFSTDQQITGYNQIGAGTPRTFTASTFALRDNGSCNATTGACTIPGNWDASPFTCPAGVTGTQQMTEWYAMGNVTSNKLTWYFQCAGGSVINNPVLSLTSTSITQGASFTGLVTNTAPGSAIQIFLQQPDGTVGQTDTGTADASGNFSRAYSTAGWTLGTYHAWVTVNNIRSNGVDFTVTAPATVSSDVLPVGATAVYKGDAKVWVASRINADTILFERWSDPLSSTDTIWRSRSQDGAIVSESSSEIHYQPVTFYDHGVPADAFGTSDGPYDIWLTPTGLYTARSGQQKTLVAARIGYGTIPAFYSRQWCGLGTICNKTLADNLWDGWPILGLVLQKENSSDVAMMFFGPFTAIGELSQISFETLQGTLTGVGNAHYINGDSIFAPCSQWTTTLGLCGGGSLYHGSNANIKLTPGDAYTGQWWTDSNDDLVIDCSEFGPSGVHINGTVPTQDLHVHGVSVAITDRNSPTRAESTWAASTEGTCAGTPPPPGRPAPTPTTAPMATLTLERDQERVQPNQPVSFSGTLDASKVAFPQGSTLFIAIPEKTGIERIEIDGRALGTGEYALSGGSAKVPFPQALYNGSHPFRIVLRNEVSSVPQLDRNIAVWVSVIDAGSKLLLKGRTASTMIAHLPTEVIGRGVSLTVPNTVNGVLPGGTFCCSVSADPTHFPIRNFSLSETDITRGPFFTPNPIPLLPENIAFTMFPSDATMQRIGMSLKQFSDPLAREFITAQYQYLLGRDPSSDEMSRYLPSFTQWRNPLAALAEVYNRRVDVRQAVLVPRDAHIGGDNSGSPLPSYDKLLEWAGTKGWQEEPSIVSYKFQTGFDDGWKPFKELWEKYAPLVGIANNVYQENYEDIFRADATVNPVSAIAWMCYKSNLNHGHFPTGNAGESLVDFEFCWKNDPVVRNYAILWAKDSGWAFNKFVRPGGNMMGGGDTAISFTPPEVVTVSSDPILAPMFGPGKYPEYGAEQQWRYPPAQLYYDLISSPEYASFPEPRFRKNIDSIYRLFLGRPAGAGDIDWVKTMFLKSNETPSGTYSPFFSWINPQWEPNGLLVASNYQYVSDVEFLTNPHYITDDVYGIRYIPGEIDAISSRLVEMLERTAAPELRQGDNFKRILSGLYRLYLRRNPTDAEVESQRASGKNFGDIEFALNQSAEYGKNPASSDAIKNIYRNYLGRDPNDADVSQWGDKTISTIANKIGTSAEMKSLAQAHPENAYIFPIKRIKIQSCGFFCSVFGKILAIAIVVAASYFGFTPVQLVAGLLPGSAAAAIAAGGIGAAIGGAALASVDAGLNLSNKVIGSISKSFNEAGFNGETFVQYVSIARAMAGQAGGVFSTVNIMENADPTILDGFRTMALAPQTPQGNAFAGLASPFAAVAGLFGAKQESQAGRIAQIDVSSHYGSGATTQVSGTVTSTKAKSGTKNSTGTVKVTAPVSFTKTLSQGSRGAEVLKLQKFLGGTDLTFLPEYRTGYYGAKTVAAVKRFQKRYGLEQTGSVGSKTRALLNSR